jgi:hypothetical protein
MRAPRCRFADFDIYAASCRHYAFAAAMPPRFRCCHHAISLIRHFSLRCRQMPMLMPIADASIS